MMEGKQRFFKKRKIEIQHSPNGHFLVIEKGKVKVQHLISHYFTLQDIPKIMPRYSELKVIKGILKFE
jgi:L-iditol 2-dehydrogenase